MTDNENTKMEQQKAILFTRIQEAAQIAIEKCSSEQRLQKEHFDKVFMELYSAGWVYFEAIRGKI